jgi:hypothetical protein
VRGNADCGDVKNHLRADRPRRAVLAAARLEVGEQRRQPEHGSRQTHQLSDSGGQAEAVDALVDACSSELGWRCPARACSASPARARGPSHAGPSPGREGPAGRCAPVGGGVVAIASAARSAVTAPRVRHGAGLCESAHDLRRARCWAMTHGGRAPQIATDGQQRIGRPNAIGGEARRLAGDLIFLMRGGGPRAVRRSRSRSREAPGYILAPT